MLKYSSKKLMNQKSNLFSNNLNDIHIGDDIKIRHQNTIESYRVVDIQIVSLEEALCLDQANNHYLTFITPYPLDCIDNAPLRLVVKVKKLPYRI